MFGHYLDGWSLGYTNSYEYGCADDAMDNGSEMDLEASSSISSQVSLY